MPRALLTLCLCLALAACGSSRLNPLNWFGGDREQRIRVTETAAEVVPTDPRPLVTEVLDLRVEQTSSGAIVQATGLVPTLGYFGGDLVEVERGDGALVFEFRVEAPEDGGTPGTPRAREILAAQALSVGALEGVRSITVIAQTNRRSVNRR